MVGSACLEKAVALGNYEVLVRARAELDLTDQTAVRAFFQKEKPDLVLDAAAKVGGIKANASQPVEFLLQNLKIQNHLMESAFANGCRKFLFLGSSCVYPKLAPQPIREDSLLTGPLEPTNEAYAIAKIAGIKLGQAYRREYGKSVISVMPANLYGPRDNFDPEASHVIPGMLGKFHQAKESGADSVPLWGTGKPLREWLYVEDLAEALFLLLEKYDGEEILNIGSGEETTIQQLAERVAKTVGFGGLLDWDTSKPDGTPRKALDSRRLFALGWTPRTPLAEGLEKTYSWFLSERGVRESSNGHLQKISQTPQFRRPRSPVH
jgi:GDP-L-fucose synthase